MATVTREAVPSTVYTYTVADLSESEAQAVANDLKLGNTVVAPIGQALQDEIDQP